MKITHTELIIYGRDYSEIARHGLYLKTAKGEVREGSCPLCEKWW